MTETEYKRIRLIRLNIGKLAQKYKFTDDSIFNETMSNIKNMMDDYLYESYTKFLSNEDNVQKVLASEHAGFVEHCRTFVDNYKQTHL